MVSIDRGNAYLKALKEHLPHVRVSFDTFHIIKNINDAIDEVRREVCRDMDKQQKKIIKGKRYLLLSGEEKLSDNSREQLAQMLAINQLLHEAYVLKEKMRMLFQFVDYLRLKLRLLTSPSFTRLF